jgi:phosphoglycolate phosphatase-like HAD superfamily hydrolase
VQIRIPATLVHWIETETKLGNPALQAAVAATHDPDLERALAWSEAVNDTVERFVRGVPPFPFLRESLDKLTGQADLVVISATPNDALRREWEEHDIARYVQAIRGQEAGTKKQTLALAAKYPPRHALMIGDAPGDYQAAVANDALFFPINPGAEVASWQRFFAEGIDRFMAGTFAGDYQAALLAEFDAFLPATPPWEQAP